MRAVFDLEADGFLDEATQIWCGSFLDLDTQEVTTYTEINDIFDRLVTLDLVVGHNLTGYDFPLLDSLHTECPCRAADTEWCFDTYEASVALKPDRGLKGHSVEEWAKRLGLPAKVEVKDWNCLPIELYIERCEHDVFIEHQIYLALLEEMGISDYHELFGAIK